MNKVTLLGRLGSDPELKYTPSGMANAKFSLATSKKWTDKQGQKQEKTAWHNIEVWGKMAEICNQYLAKGRQVLILGEIDYQVWDKPDGTKGYMTKINASEVEFVGSAPQAGEGQPNNNNAGNQNRGQSNARNQQGSAASHHGSSNLNPGDLPPEYDISTDTNFTADDIPF